MLSCYECELEKEEKNERLTEKKEQNLEISLQRISLQKTSLQHLHQLTLTNVIRILKLSSKSFVNSINPCKNYGPLFETFVYLGTIIFIRSSLPGNLFSLAAQQGQWLVYCLLTPFFAWVQLLSLSVYFPQPSAAIDQRKTRDAATVIQQQSSSSSSSSAIDDENQNLIPSPAAEYDSRKQSMIHHRLRILRGVNNNPESGEKSRRMRKGTDDRYEMTRTSGGRRGEGGGRIVFAPKTPSKSPTGRDFAGPGFRLSIGLPISQKGVRPSHVASGFCEDRNTSSDIHTASQKTSF